MPQEPRSSLLPQKGYLVPHAKNKELVILTDNVLNLALMATPERTMALSRVAAEILRNSLFGSPLQALEKKVVPLKVSDAISGTTEQRTSAIAWLQDLADDGWFQFSSKIPKVHITKQGRVSSGGHIPVAAFGGGKGVPVEYDGTLISATVNRAKVHWYFSDISLREKQAIVDQGIANSVSDVGPLGTTLYPKPVPMRLGANCNICGACGTCGACGACALCGGVDFGVALAAAVAVDATLALTNALSVLSGLRED